MFETFSNHVKNKKYFQDKKKIVLAISGGIDSMVLLRFMERLSEKEHFSIGVAHVNHKMREESEIEFEYLQHYCQQHDIPFFYRNWLAEEKEKNTEARARKFRYDFFAEIMLEQNYSTLLTAHHGDDQAETILMKLTRGSNLFNLVGIRDVQPFGGGELIRPFLIFSKEELELFAKKSKIVYFEDSTNQTDDYMRNRIRHQVIPVLKKENKQFLTHIEQLSSHISLAEDVIQSLIMPKYNSWVKKQGNGWCLDLSHLKTEEASIQFFFMNTFLQNTIVKKGIEIKQVQLQQILKIINQSTPQLMIELESNWVFKKEYEMGYLIKKITNDANKKFSLNVSESFYLSESEWIGLESSTERIVIPKKISEWCQYSLSVSAEIPLPLTVRHRLDGDKITSETGRIKKLNRLFIEKKIPNTIRNDTWIILSALEEIIWVPKIANSYLSIPAETDKIHYRLLYRTKE